MRFLSVVPAEREALGPEPITSGLNFDLGGYGFRARRCAAPRNDTRGSCLAPRPRDRFHGVDDGLIAGAAAVVAGQMLANGGATDVGAALQQLLGGEQHAGRAIAALQRVALVKSVLQVGDLTGIR